MNTKKTRVNNERHFEKRKQTTFFHEGLKGVRAFAAKGSNLANLSQGLISFHCGTQKKFYGLLFYYDKRLNFWLTPLRLSFKENTYG